MALSSCLFGQVRQDLACRRSDRSGRSISSVADAASSTAARRDATCPMAYDEMSNPYASTPRARSASDQEPPRAAGVERSSGPQRCRDSDRRCFAEERRPHRVARVGPAAAGRVVVRAEIGDRSTGARRHTRAYSRSGMTEIETSIADNRAAVERIRRDRDVARRGALDDAAGAGGVDAARRSSSTWPSSTSTAATSRSASRGPARCRGFLRPLLRRVRRRLGVEGGDSSRRKGKAPGYC